MSLCRGRRPAQQKSNRIALKRSAMVRSAMVCPCRAEPVAAALHAQRDRPCRDTGSVPSGIKAGWFAHGGPTEGLRLPARSGIVCTCPLFNSSARPWTAKDETETDKASAQTGAPDTWTLRARRAPQYLRRQTEPSGTDEGGLRALWSTVGHGKALSERQVTIKRSSPRKCTRGTGAIQTRRRWFEKSGDE